VVAIFSILTVYIREQQISKINSGLLYKRFKNTWLPTAL